MKYNFDKQIERRGTNSYKWDLSKEEDVIPMWVADMDFQTAPCIIEALKKRVEHGVFGYTLVPDSYYESITNWFKRRHNWQIDRSWILYTSGVVPALTASLQAMTMQGEKVLIQTPAYNCFFTSIKNCGCQVAQTELKREGNSFVMDFDDFESKCADPMITVFVLCNPHNPSGRVWNKEELLRINDICTRNGVKIISDEIHCELIMPGYTFTPFASVSDECRDNSVTLNSPSKSFNIAGLQIANIICSNQTLRRRINRALNINEVCDVNPFGVIALQEAYNNGEEWLDELNEYLYGNYKALKDFFTEYLPKLEVIRLEGTYLVWIDISRIELTADEAAKKLLDNAKVKINSGTMYGRKEGFCYLRINIACTRVNLMEGLKRMGRELGVYMEDDDEHGCPM